MADDILLCDDPVRVPPSEPPLALLDRIARRLGLPASPHAARSSAGATPGDPGALVALDDPDALVWLDEPEVRQTLAAIAAGAASPDSSAELAARVGALCGKRADVALLSEAAELSVALAAAARRRRPGRIVIVGDALAHVPADVAAGGAERHPARSAATALAAEPAPSLVVVEPFVPEAEAIVAAARARGAAVAVDGTRCAFRLAPAAWNAACAAADFAVVGPALAAGLPFFALVGAEAGDALDPVVRTVAGAVSAALRRRPPHADLLAAGAAIVAAIEAAAAEHDIHVVVRGSPSLPWLEFAGQEGAPPDLIEHHFVQELEAAGVRARGPLLWPASVRTDPAVGSRVERAFAHAMLRLRVLFVEYNSHLSGGLPWPFATGEARLRARGLTFYRFPRLADVEVAPIGAAMRIAFGPGELGAVTSSGFFVPTRLVGDVVLTIRYELQRWHSGPDSACLGLFLQNEASTARYYAQVHSTADAPHVRTAAAGFAGELVGRRTADGDRGWLRLVRRGGELIALHRAAGAPEFVELGRCEASPDILIAGCKIWSKVRTDGLVADLFELEIEADLAADQPELLPARPDPRRPEGHRD